MTVTVEVRRPEPAGIVPRDTGTLVWVALLALTLVMLALRSSWGWIIEYPEAWTLPVTEWLDASMDAFVAAFGWIFRWASNVLAVPMGWIRDILQWLPWSTFTALLVLLGWRAGGWTLALLTLAACLYMVVVGYWEESMNSLALVAISVPLAVLIGFAVGAIGYRSETAQKIISPILDLLQTIPAFAYLLPILLLFGFGPVVGLIASVLFAFPPMVRNTMLGLNRVPSEIIESGLMSGATPRQLFWRVRVPSALRQLLLGVNQTTMAAFSMVIIASIIGGTSDIGWEVLQHIRKAQFGESLLSGFVIALMAMVMDRITHGLATDDSHDPPSDAPVWQRHPWWVAAVAILVAGVLLARVFPVLEEWPRAWVWYPAEPMNEALTWLIAEYTAAIKAIKTWAFFYLMLPVKTGLEKTISPFSWGWEFTATRQWLYAALAFAAVAWAWLSGRQRLAIGLGFFFILIFFGLTRLPWAALILMTAWLGYELGGWKLAAGTAAGLVFLAVAGVWPEAMLSVYLCGIAVVLCFVIGTAIGIAASEIEWVSRVVRPINDTLQTMPLFVLLIPFVMVFKIGEFTALLSIMAYAIVPSIRYAEHGLRNVSSQVIEPAECMGCTRWQMLWRVKIPLALPVIMLGLNQTIMYGISMLVIAALVGTNGLGQQIYIGLGDGDFGVGMVAGIGMAIIGIVADRMTQAWSKKRQKRYGQ